MTTTTRKIMIVSVVTLCVVGVAVALFRLSRPARRPNVSITFTGFTNSAAGIRLASFFLSNASPRSVHRESGFHIQTLTAGRWSTFTNDFLAAGGRVLRPGQSELLTVTAPVGQQQWRAVFLAANAENPLKSMATELLLEAQKLGLPTRYRRVGHGAVSDLIQE